MKICRHDSIKTDNSLPAHTYNGSSAGSPLKPWNRPHLFALRVKHDLHTTSSVRSRIAQPLHFKSAAQPPLGLRTRERPDVSNCRNTMHTFTPQDAHSDVPASPSVESLDSFRRSPNPYSLHRDNLHRTGSPSEAPTQNPSVTRSPPCCSNSATSDNEGGNNGKRGWQSPSESGTEADDEGYTFVKALPAPPLRPHKGLRNRNGMGQDELSSPLLTPTQVDDEDRKYTDSYMKVDSGTLQRKGASPGNEEARLARKKYLKRRRNEVVRRVTETALLACIGILAVSGCGCWGSLLEWHRGTSSGREQ